MEAQPIPVCIFAKPPAVGEVKTRLANAIGPAHAARLAAALFDDTLRAVRACPWALPIVATTDPESWRPDGAAQVWSQGEGDLGARVERVLRRALAEHPQAVAVGADAPATLGPRLARARAKLTSADAVMGPTGDGGFDLLALHRCPEGLLRNLPWSVPTTCAQTLRRLRSHGLRVNILDVTFDVDRPDDLARLGHLLSTAPHLAPATWQVLCGDHQGGSAGRIVLEHTRSATQGPSGRNISAPHATHGQRAPSAWAPSRRSPTMMSCDEVARELSDALDGELSLWRRLQIRMHLAMCKVCRRVSASLGRTVDTLHSLRDEPPRVDGE